MQTVPIQETISFSQLRTQTRRLETLLVAQRTVTLIKGSKVVGHIIPKTGIAVTASRHSIPLFVKGLNLGGDFKKPIVKRRDFYT